MRKFFEGIWQHFNALVVAVLAGFMYHQGDYAWAMLFAVLTGMSVALFWVEHKVKGVSDDPS